MNELTNISYNVGEVVENLESAKTYAKDKKFSEFEVVEIADGLKHVSALENVTAKEIAYRLLAVKEHSSAEILGKYLGKEKSDIYEFSKVVTGKSKGATSQYLKVAEVFRYRDDKTKYIPNKEKYYMDEVANKFNFETLLSVAKCKELELLSDKYAFLEKLPEGLTALEVKDELRKLSEDETEENAEVATEETAEIATEETAELATEETAENVSREAFEVKFEELNATLKEKLRAYILKNAGEKPENVTIVGIKY